MKIRLGSRMWWIRSAYREYKAAAYWSSRLLIPRFPNEPARRAYKGYVRGALDWGTKDLARAFGRRPKLAPYKPPVNGTQKQYAPPIRKPDPADRFHMV